MAIIDEINNTTEDNYEKEKRLLLSNKQLNLWLEENRAKIENSELNIISVEQSDKSMFTVRFMEKNIL